MLHLVYVARERKRMENRWAGEDRVGRMLGVGGWVRLNKVEESSYIDKSSGGRRTSRRDHIMKQG